MRDKYSGVPSIAAAYELALAFSLPDAPLLCHLSKQLSKSEESAELGYRLDSLYRTYKIPKKAGGTRTITVPEDSLKRLQGRILRKGLDVIRLPRCVKGFRRGESIVTNASAHVGKAMVVNVDISSFFPSTGFERIRDACGLVVGGVLSAQATRLLAEICSFGGGLPMGAPTSPALGNLVLRRADYAIRNAARKYDIAYTRYADDLTFSGKRDVHRIIPFVARVLKELGYKLDLKKTGIYRRGRRQMVTGLVVNEKVNVPRRVRRRIRAAVHRKANGQTPHWHDEIMYMPELLGRLAFLNQVRPDEAERLLKQLRAER